MSRKIGNHLHAHRVSSTPHKSTPTAIGSDSVTSASFSPVERFVRRIRRDYTDGTSGHHPHVAESVIVALDAAEHSSLDGESTAGTLRAALTRLARCAESRAVEHESHTQAAANAGCRSVTTYLAAWSAATADELWRIVRTIETELPGL